MLTPVSGYNHCAQRGLVGFVSRAAPGELGVRLKILAIRWYAFAAGALADIAVFVLVVSFSGLQLEAAQLCAFTAAAVVAVALVRRADLMVRVGPAIVIAAFAYCLRAGVLALGVVQFGWPPLAAIVPAALAGALAARLGMPFFVGAGSHSLGSRSVPLRTAVVLAIVYLIVLRLVYIGQVELMPQEAYYWNYAQHLDIGYLDHPPLIAWLIAAATAIGRDEFFVRLAAVACWLVMLYYVVHYARDLAGPDAAIRAALLAAVLPFCFAIGVLMTPDAPLAAAWAAALYFLARALVAGDERAWPGAGIAIGAGMLSKYSMVLVPFALLVFVLVDAPSRRVLRSPWAWGGALLALAVFSPVILWNVQHDWASFTFQGARRLAGRGYQFDFPLFIGFALLLLTPWGAVALVRGMARSRVVLTGATGDITRADDGRQLAARKTRFIAVFTFVPLAVFGITSFWSETKLHWTGPIWLGALPLIAAGFDLPRQAARRRPVDRWLARSFGPLAHALMLIYAFGLFYYPVYGLAGIRTHHHYFQMGWRDLRERIQAIEDEVLAETGRRPAIVGLDKHNTADEMAYYDPRGDGAVDTASRHLFVDDDALMYGFWFPRAAFDGRDLIVVGRRRSDLEDSRLAERATRLGPIRTITALKGGVAVGEYYARVVYGYHASDRPPL